MNQDEVESQLSAMFDGELPAAECELLSRRIDRDEVLRARWARYALIGAAMRCEPVATARSDFAARVSRAVGRVEGSGRRPSRARAWLWQGALAASLTAAVAGLSITLLRNVAVPSVALNGGDGTGSELSASAPPAAHLLAVARRARESAAELLDRQRQAASVLFPAPTGPRAAAVAAHEPWSYVTPPNDSAASTPLRTELVDYIVAHSAYSTPLMRPDLLSALMAGGEEADGTPSGSVPPGGTGGPSAAGITPVSHVSGASPAAR